MAQKTSNFIETLQSQARQSSSLNQSHLLPQQLGFFTSLIGNYPWQVVLVLSGLTAVFLEGLSR